MPEILRDMMKRVLSLKHLCCQEIVTRFWCSHEIDKFPRAGNTSYYKRLGNSEIDVKLPRFISSLGVPKTLEIDLFEIGLAMLLELYRFYPRFNKHNLWFNVLGSSVVFLNPTGGINLDDTIQNILQLPQLDTNAKLYLAIEFRTFDPFVSDNFEDYIDVMSGHCQGMDLGKRREFSRPMPHEIPNRIRDMIFLELKQTWKMFSQQDKEQLSGNLDQIALELGLWHMRHSPNIGFLLDNLFTEKTRNFWKLFGSDDPVDEFCFKKQLHRFLDYLASPFCYLDQNSMNLFKEFPDATLSCVLAVMLELIVMEFCDALYRYWIEIWHGSSEQFRLDFCREYEGIIYNVLYGWSVHNLEFALQIFILLQPFSPNLKFNTEPEFLESHLLFFLDFEVPFRPPDNYLNKFAGSKDKIGFMKKQAIWTDICRETIVVRLKRNECSALIKDIVHWALATKEERDEYKSALHEYALDVYASDISLQIAHL